MDKAQYHQLFLFAAKAGALEGYLYDREKAEPLVNWVDNISRMYGELSPEVKRGVAPVVTPVLERIFKYVDRLLESALKEKLQQIFVAASAESGAEKAD